MIQQLFSGMLTLMLAKFVLNDVPHAAGMLSPGNPIRVQQLTVDMVMDDLERTRRMMDPEMQESLGILKDVMAQYYLEPCVVAWDNGNLIGILVYDTYKDIDADVQTTHIAQLASFTLAPGAGRTLVDKVISIGLKAGSDIISVGHGPGARGFYEKLGFTQNIYEPEVPQSMMYKLKGGSSHAPMGTCYPDAWRFLMQKGDGYLIHGSAQLSEEGARVSHAWVETGYGWVWEPQTRQWFMVDDFKRMFAPIEDARYSGEEAAIMVARVGKHGPWSTEERNNILGGRQWHTIGK